MKIEHRKRFLGKRNNYRKLKSFNSCPLIQWPQVTSRSGVYTYIKVAESQQVQLLLKYQLHRNKTISHSKLYSILKRSQSLATIALVLVPARPCNLIEAY